MSSRILIQHLKLKLDSSMGFTSFSAAVVFFKTRLYCPYLRSLCFNFCDELGERKM